MPADLKTARDLFLHAVGKLPPEQWDGYVAEACGGDATLEQQVGHLLKVHRDAGSFLGRPAAGVGETWAFPEPAAAATVLVHEGAGTVVGPYKLLQQIGEGGMGTVFMAEQVQPIRRKVAVKIIKPGMDSRQVVARFEQERQALAMMDHVNIARVLDAGATDAGRPYFVMELVHGVPITRYCDDQHLTPRERLELFVPVCQAIQHAHQKGIIHRDVKPSNVLVTLYDGRPVPKVIDFGVAKATEQPLTERTLFTQYGTMVGTLEYMSPEQAEMSALGIDTRSDIYSLGVLLYELLAGSTPFSRDRFKQAAYDEIRRIIREEEPPNPSTRLSGSKDALPAISARRQTEPAKLTKLVRGELDWVVMKALEKDRNRRYESAGAFVADVRRYLADEPVQACPPSAWYRFRKFARRHRRAVAVGATLAALLLLGTVGTSVGLAWALRAERTASAAADAAARAKGDLKQTLDDERVEAYFRSVALAHSELSVHRLGGALKLLDDCPHDLRGWEWRYLMRLCRVEPVVIRPGAGVNGIAFHHDGEFLASAAGDGSIAILNSRTGRTIRRLEKAHQGFVCGVAFHRDGDHVASVGADRLVKVWNLTTGLSVFERPCDAIHPFGTAYAAAFSPLNPDHLAAGCDGTVTIWDWKHDRPVHTFPGHETDRITVAFSRDGRRLATGNWQGTVKVWDAVAGGGPSHTFVPTRGTRHPAVALAFSPDNARLAAASFDRCVELWDTTTGRALDPLPHPESTVLGLAFSPDGRLLASAGEDKTVRVWDAVSGRKLLGLHGHKGMCGCVTFSPDSLRLASAGKDGTIHIWDATPLRGDERQEAAKFTDHQAEIWTLAVGPDGRTIVSGGFGPPVLVWDAMTRDVTARFGGQEAVVFCVAWHPDGRRFASAGSSDGHFTVRVGDVTTGADLFTLPAPGRPEFFAVAFSPDGRYLVTGRGNGFVEVWDANTGLPIRPLGAHAGPVRGLVFGRDGSLLATIGDDGAVKLWDATGLAASKTPQDPLPTTFSGHVAGPGVNVAFSPDGKWLAIGDKDYTVKVCDVETGAVRHVLRGHNGDVYTVVFSPDGRLVASAGEDSTVKVWDGSTGQPVRTFRGHTGLVTSLAFTGDGKFLVSGSRDRTVKLWDVTRLRGGPER